MIYRILYWISAFCLIVSGSQYLFQALPYTLIGIPEEGVPAQLVPVIYPEVVFVVTSWWLMYMAVSGRVFVLVSLVAGQITLYWLNPHFWIAGYVVPYYGLIAANCVYLLILYFVFSQEKWAPNFLRPEEFDPHRR